MRLFEAKKIVDDGIITNLDTLIEIVRSVKLEQHEDNRNYSNLCSSLLERPNVTYEQFLKIVKSGTDSSSTCHSKAYSSISSVEQILEIDAIFKKRKESIGWYNSRLESSIHLTKWFKNIKSFDEFLQLGELASEKEVWQYLNSTNLQWKSKSQKDLVELGKSLNDYRAWYTIIGTKVITDAKTLVEIGKLANNNEVWRKIIESDLIQDPQILISIGNLVNKEYEWTLIIKSETIKSESLLIEIGKKSGLWDLVNTAIKKLREPIQIASKPDKSKPDKLSSSAEGCLGCLVTFGLLAILAVGTMSTLHFVFSKINPAQPPRIKSVSSTSTQISSKKTTSTKSKKSKARACNSKTGRSCS